MNGRRHLWTDLGSSGRLVKAAGGGGAGVPVLLVVLVDDVDFLLVAEPAARPEVVGGTFISHLCSSRLPKQPCLTWSNWPVPILANLESGQYPAYANAVPSTSRRWSPSKRSPPTYPMPYRLR